MYICVFGSPLLMENKYHQYCCFVGKQAFPFFFLSFVEIFLYFICQFFDICSYLSARLNAKVLGFLLMLQIIHRRIAHSWWSEMVVVLLAGHTVVDDRWSQVPASIYDHSLLLHCYTSPLSSVTANNRALTLCHSFSLSPTHTQHTVSKLETEPSGKEAQFWETYNTDAHKRTRIAYHWNALCSRWIVCA